MAKLRSYFFLFRFFILLLAFPACIPEIRGEFGWASWDNRGTDKAERKLRIVRKFYLNRENLHFSDYETIYWIYRITSGFYFNDKFLATLYEDNYTPQPILIDMREASLFEGDPYDYIRYYYEGLKPGPYLLRIAYNSKIIDDVKFLVFPKKEEEPLPRREYRDEEEDELYMIRRLGDEIDEIEYYSRGNFFRPAFSN